MISYKKVLIPTDFSAAAWNAVQEGMKMVDPDGEITLLHVYPSHAKFSTPKRSDNDGNDEIFNSLKSDMNDFCAQLELGGKVKVKAELMEGKVETTILEYISAHTLDIILMGVNSNATDNHPGSHVKFIMANSQVPVLIIPNNPMDTLSE